MILEFLQSNLLFDVTFHEILKLFIQVGIFVVLFMDFQYSLIDLFSFKALSNHSQNMEPGVKIQNKFVCFQPLKSEKKLFNLKTCLFQPLSKARQWRRCYTSGSFYLIPFKSSYILIPSRWLMYVIQTLLWLWVINKYIVQQHNRKLDINWCVLWN